MPLKPDAYWIIPTTQKAMRANPDYYNQKEPPCAFVCGTPCCVEGFLLWVADGQKKAPYCDNYPPFAVEEILGVNNFVAMSMWSATASLWPTKARIAYQLARTNKQRVEAACLMLDLLLENNGKLPR